MSESTFVRPRDVRSRVVIAIGAAVVACGALGVASVLANLAPAAPAAVENTAANAPIAYPPSREAWYVEPKTALTTQDAAYQARDAWDK
jgi:hypothetical protein